MGKMVIGDRIYDAVFDENGEAVELSRYNEEHGITVTLCFDNTSDGSAGEELLKCLKSRFLKNFAV